MGLTDADVLVPVVDQPLVDLVADAQHVVLLAQAGHQLQFGLREHLQGHPPHTHTQRPAQREKGTAQCRAKGPSARILLNP